MNHRCIKKFMMLYTLPFFLFHLFVSIRDINQDYIDIHLYCHPVCPVRTVIEYDVSLKKSSKLMMCTKPGLFTHSDDKQFLLLVSHQKLNDSGKWYVTNKMNFISEQNYESKILKKKCKLFRISFIYISVLIQIYIHLNRIN